MAVFHRVRFDAHDPVIVIETDRAGFSGVLGEGRHRLAIVRDVELESAAKGLRADEIKVYQDFTPSGGLSGDRPTATAQAAVEALTRFGITGVTADRTLMLLYADALAKAGIRVELDPDLGVLDRRAKDAQEVEALRRAQTVTERAIEAALRMIARADADADGTLLHADGPDGKLHADTVRATINKVLGDAGFSWGTHIVACGPQGADCHADGGGVLKTGQPIIVDVFPKDNASGYHGDCTRMVVHGDIPDEVAHMHDTVLKAKDASIAAIRAGVTGEAAHLAGVRIIEAAGYHMGFPPKDPPAGYCSMPHGTGHGLGLELKEPPLLDMKGPELIVGDAVTVEPGLYKLGVGGMRLEDLVIVTADGCENLNTLGCGLDWR